ncbi:RICIN domain-containing protein [Luteimonas sp. JM171]|uniref:RICIN domain-containing protein n=1 Tax=Luteimonas sp. JM171 TaxID=1896164 RepID=UPI000BA31F3F
MEGLAMKRIVFCMILAGFGTGPAVASSSTTIENFQLQHCLAPVSSTSGAFVELQSCTGAEIQLWQYEHMRYSHLRLRNKATNMCLDLQTASGADGIRAIQRPCSTNQTQRWHFNSTYNHYPEDSLKITSLTNVFSEKCLAIQTGVGTVYQWNCNGKTDQRWWSWP